MGSKKDRLPVEMELRLAGKPDALQAAFDSVPTAAVISRAKAATDLDNSYFDTSDHRLRAKGLAFRVRRHEKEHRQTLKTGDDANAAVLERGEWETPLKDDQPCLEALPKRARKLLSRAAGDGELQKVFETRVQRQAQQLLVNGQNEQGSKIEMTLDLGEIETGAGSLPIAEIELELLEGRPPSLYKLGVELLESAPLGLETRSKSSRAYDQLLEQPPRWHRTKSPSLTRETSVDDAMAKIFKSCFDQWLVNQAAAFDGRDPEGVHQMRIGLRRLRSALSAFGMLIPADQLVWLKSDAKQTINALGAARDWDVFQIDLLAPVIAARPTDRNLRGLAKRVETRRRANYRAVRKNLESKDYTRLALRFGHWLEERLWRIGRSAEQSEQGGMPIVAFAARRLKKRHRLALSHGKGFADLPVAQRHELRIVLKKLRYTTEFFTPLFKRKAVKPFLSHLESLQDDLGHMNDLAVAETLLLDLLTDPGKRDIGSAAGIVIGWHERGVADLESDLVRDWNAFAKSTPFWN